MILKLIKQNKKTADVVFLEQEDNLIRKKEGKQGKPVSFSSTSNLGNTENALQELEKLKQEYILKGYSLFEDEIIEFETFDKAKWHLEGEFPKDAKPFQAYIHTGFYIGWLILSDLISAELKSNSANAIDDFRNKKITAPQFFEEQLDGTFTSNDVNKKGFDFTKLYFDFEKGQYLNDYETLLAPQLETMYHVADNWENFNKICTKLDSRFTELTH